MPGFSEEHQLAEAILRGDEEAFKAFLERFGFYLAKAYRKAAKLWPQAGQDAYRRFCQRVARSLANRYIQVQDKAKEQGLQGIDFDSLLKKLYLTDLFIVSSMESGSDEAWRAFHRSFQSDLKSTVRSFVKNPFLRSDVLEGLDGDLFGGGQSGRGLLASYEGTGPLGGWLRTVVYRRALASWKQRSRMPKPLASEEAHPPRNGYRPGGTRDADPLPVDFLTSLKTAIREAFADLPPRDKTLLLLRYTRGMTQKKLALTQGWGESRLSRHFQQVRKSLLLDIRRRSGLSSEEFAESLPAIRRSLGTIAGECFSINGNFS